MRKRNLVSLIACVLCVAVLVGAVSVFSGLNFKTATAESQQFKVSVGHVSDIHILTEADSNEASAKYNAKNATEAKYLAESTSSLRQTFYQMLGDPEHPKADAPLYVLASGDLTLNGEYSGHLYLRDFFTEITQMMRSRASIQGFEQYKNFQILVVPGNHDLYNPNAATYTPTQEELDACQTYEEKVELMSNYKSFARTTSSTEFMDIYKDFGYGGDNMADNFEIEFFYQTDYWYDDVLDYSYGGYDSFDDEPRLDLGYPTSSEYAEFKRLGKAFPIYNRAVRHGACSYIARTPDVTFVCIDGNSRDYIGDKSNVGSTGNSVVTDWKESTGGEISDMQLRWIQSSLKADVSGDKLIISQLHQNVIPHFEMEDQVLSLFTFDDYRRAINALADAGIKYCFTGHMHASDIAKAISQNGNVIYDFETGSPIAYGSSSRITEFVTSGSGDDYVEDVTSKVLNLDMILDYGYSAIDEDGKLYIKKAQTEFSHYDYFKNKLYNMIPVMAKSFVNDDLFSGLIDKVSEKLSSFPFLADFAKEALTGIDQMDFYPFNTDANNLPKLGTQVKKGYGIIDFVDDLVDWLVSYDFSNGKVEGGYTVGQILMDAYAVHLAGTNPATIEGNEGLKIFMGKLQDGSFVDNLVKYVCELLLPQVDLILNAPVRFNKDSATLEAGKGFDFSASLSAKYDMINGTIQNIIKNYAFEYDYDDPEEGIVTTYFYDVQTGYSSLKLMLNGILHNADDILGMLDQKPLKNIVEPFGIQTYIDKYYNKVKSYANKYFESKDLYEFAMDKLVNKYVTDAFCKNLGDYAYRILMSLATDDTYDGLTLQNDQLVSESVKLTYTLDGKVLFGGHSYAKENVSVTPSVDNGLLPANISIADVVKDGVLSPTSKSISWRTRINVDLFSKNENGEYVYSVPASYIVYATSQEALKDAERIKADGVNKDLVYPTIDLGILFFNMSYLYETYNVYEITLEGLKEDTLYYYSVGNDYGWSEVNTFKTVKTSGANGYTVLGITDIQGSVEKNYVESMPNMQVALDTVTSPDFIISAGDNVDNGKNISQWGWLLNDQRKVWANNSFVGAPGNHEDGYRELSDNFLLPNQSTGMEYYSFFYVNTKYIVLDTNDLENNMLSSTQYDWLVSELTSANADENVKWIVVVMHKGLYTAGSHAFDDDVIALRKQLTQVFATYNVDLVLQGHDHTYTVSKYLDKDANPVENEIDARGAVIESQGVLYVNMGTMGDKFYDYLYSDSIKDVFIERSSAPQELKSYLKDGKLELTETPVFISLNVTDNDLRFTSYGVVNGKAVTIDQIVLSHTADYTKPQSGLSAGAIAGIVVGSVVGAGLIAACVIILIRKKRAV